MIKFVEEPMGLGMTISATYMAYLQSGPFRMESITGKLVKQKVLSNYKLRPAVGGQKKL